MNLLLGFLLIATTTTAPAPPIAITKITMIDPGASAPKPDMTVIISGRRITDIGRLIEIPAPRVAYPAGAK